MSEEFVELAPAILDHTGVNSPDIRTGIVEALHYLDGHPEVVPSSPAKPTITAGEVGRRSHLVRGGNVETPSLVDFLEALGIEVIPDPVPTNAERLAALMYEADEKDHSSVPGGWEHVAEFLDRAGVTAPGGEE